MKSLGNVFKGVLIGAGAIIPGISSGVLCVILGIYEKILNSVLNFFSDVKGNFKYLFPFIVGIGIGVIIFSNILEFLFYRFPIQINSIFIGLIIGTIPALLKDVNKKEKFEKKNLIFLFIALIIGIGTVILENNFNVQNNIDINYIYLFISGFVMSLGIIIPGVSSTIILMLLGVYSTYLQSIANMYLPVLIPMGLGLILGSIIVMKLMKYLMQKYYGKIFYSIIGFTIGSLFVLFPEIYGMCFNDFMCIIRYFCSKKIRIPLVNIIKFWYNSTINNIEEREQWIIKI